MYAQRPQVQIISASTLRQSRNLLRRYDSSDIPINVAYYLNSNVAPVTSTSLNRLQSYANGDLPNRRAQNYRQNSQLHDQGTSKRDHYYRKRPERSASHRQYPSRPSRDYNYDDDHRTSYSTKYSRSEYPATRPLRYASSMFSVYDPYQMYYREPVKNNRSQSYETEKMNGYGYYPAPARSRSFYDPSYAASYPAAFRNPYYFTDNQRKEKRWHYGVILRLFMKLAQIVSGLAVVGLIVGPAAGSPFHDWVVKYETEGQLAILILTIICLLFSAMMLCSLGMSKYQAWRNMRSLLKDGALSAFSCTIYLAITVVESWYAACYIPYGRFFPMMCHRVEWILAAIFAAVSLLFYIADVALAIRGGASLL